MRTILNVPELQTKKFDAADIDEDLVEIGKEFHAAYQRVDSTEIWTDTTIAGIIQQLLFYWESGVFRSAEVAIQLCEELKDLLQHVERQAQEGTKVALENGFERRGGKFTLYYSEIEFENNCIMLRSGDVGSVYLGHLSFRSLKTSDPRYLEETTKWVDNLKTKSHLISGTSETTRYKFFRRCTSKIDRLVQQIESF